MTYQTSLLNYYEDTKNTFAYRNFLLTEIIVVNTVCLQ